jgi:hypothetical protein
LVELRKSLDLEPDGFETLVATFRAVQGPSLEYRKWKLNMIERK